MDDTSYLEDLPSTTPSHDQRPAGLHAGCDCGSEPEQTDPWRKGFTRRRVMQGSSAMVAALGLQTVTSRYAFSATKALNTDTIVVVNLRGGWDSLSIVVPTFEDAYYAQRPNVAIPKAAALPLAGGFGLHPALPNMHKLYKGGKFAPVIATGTPDKTLSHFEAMDTLERGTGSGANSSGWMNRVLQARSQTGVFSAVQFGSQLPLALSGDAPALALSNVQSFGLAGYDDVSAQAATAFAGLYRGLKHPMAGQVTDTLKAVSAVSKLREKEYVPANGAKYPDGGLGGTLKDAARLVKGKLGLTMAAIDVGGWDMHTNEGRVDAGDLRSHMEELDNSLNAFVTDLGAEFGNVTVVLVSEFGRTVKENGTVGTDHGHGQAMWVLGGGINGGKVYGKWPTLAEDKLFLNGSLAATTDYRDVLGDVLAKRGGVGSFKGVFPDYTPKPLGISKARS
jgi:uncharacterized protein (DUF1501 family)